MKLLIDMNLSPEWCARLQTAGFDAVHWSSIGRANAEDDALFNWARANRAVLLTQDLDFSAIHARLRTGMPSVVQIRSGDLTPAVIGNVVVRALAEHESALAEGAILSIDLFSARVRRLPL
jgi:predicted nuclease of predicted toxin-antitoxin system